MSTLSELSTAAILLRTTSQLLFVVLPVKRAMTSPESPAGARRRVRPALREAREAAGLTQSQVAEEMEWSTSKVIRIESGEVSISQYDLRPLLALLGITDRAEVRLEVETRRRVRMEARQRCGCSPTTSTRRCRCSARTTFSVAGGAKKDAVLYRESHLIDEIDEDPADVARHRASFDRYWEIPWTCRRQRI
jgi:transcriptional regulator with XRE-family HTH domain